MAQPTLQNFQRSLDADSARGAWERQWDAVVVPLEEVYHRREWGAGDILAGPAAALSLEANRGPALIVPPPDSGQVHHVAAGRVRLPTEWKSGFLGLALRLAPADGGAGDASFPLTLSVRYDADDHAAAADLSFTDTVTMPGTALAVVTHDGSEELTFEGAYNLVTWSLSRAADTYAGAIHLLAVTLTFRPQEIQH